MTFVITQSGLRVDLVNPDPATISLRDIAVHLSRINRFAGATSRPWSVASHSLIVHRILHDACLDPDTRLLGLLHDAHEAYLGDLIRPVRVVIRSQPFRNLCIGLDQAIRTALGLNGPTYEQASLIDAADEMALATEWRDLMPDGTAPDLDPTITPAKFAIPVESPTGAADNFLALAEALLRRRTP